MGGNLGHMGDASNEMGDDLPSISLGTGRTAVEISTGEYRTCFRLDDGTLKCWGHNNFGQLGIGSTTWRTGILSGEMGDNRLPINLGTWV